MIKYKYINQTYTISCNFQDYRDLIKVIRFYCSGKYNVSLVRLVAEILHLLTKMRCYHYSKQFIRGSESDKALC